tara:strand:- start:1744 stop:2058 length:315 start_codon:yes stop_codon:yes gene_type:complete
MNTKINYITPIKKQLDEKMHEVCNMFMLIGTPRETPRYYNLKDYKEKVNNSCLIQIFSTLNRNLGFEILTPIDYPFIDFDEFWQQFKDYRTQFLLKNYPTINAY